MKKLPKGDAGRNGETAQMPQGSSPGRITRRIEVTVEREVITMICERAAGAVRVHPQPTNTPESCSAMPSNVPLDQNTPVPEKTNGKFAVKGKQSGS